MSDRNFPDRGVPDTIKVDGKTFECRIVEREEELVVFYQKEMEDHASGHDEKMNALNGLVNSINRPENKPVIYRAE